jgi:hypothetical protein
MPKSKLGFVDEPCLEVLPSISVDADGGTVSSTLKYNYFCF